MNDFSEAPASINFTVVSPKGFNPQITIRGEDALKLIASYETLENTLVEKGYKPQAPKSFGGPRPEKKIEYVEGRFCPKCKNKLIYFESKGKRHIKCSTSKYDWKTKQSSGCNFIEWSDGLKQESSMNDFPNRGGATQAQISLIKKLQEEERITVDVDFPSLTKENASKIIKEALPK